MTARRPDGTWRRACVVRAQTVAGDTRLLDLAVEPAHPELEPGSLLAVVFEDDGVTSIHPHVAMPIGPGLLRISVKRRGPNHHGLRFLWSLVEGATIEFRARPRRLSSGAATGRVTSDTGLVAKLRDLRPPAGRLGSRLTP